MGQTGKREVTQTYSLFMCDLKVYQESHLMLKKVNETIIQARDDTGACYWCGKMCRNHFRKRKDGKMGRTLGASGEDENHGPDQKEIYKFLGVEQAEWIKI